MAKVKMYRGIDPFDGSDSLFAVCEGSVPSNFYNDKSKWLSPERFEDPSSWVFGSTIDPSTLTDEKRFELLWEADL